MFGENGELARDALLEVLQVWAKYRRNEVLINSTFLKYGKLGKAHLDLSQVMAMMEGFREKDCNVKVNEVSAAYVIKEATAARVKREGLTQVILKNKKIISGETRVRRDELHTALRAWSFYMTKHGSTSKCCVIS